jgi:Lon protease-like protein
MNVALDRLPIFPLPDVVLFPHAVMPLHVFEPRYRAMTRDVLAGDRMLSVVRLRPGFENDYDGRPPVYDIAGMGEVVQSQAMPDGRFNLLIRGITRVRIERELPPDTPYRIVTARALHDEYSGADLGIARAALEALADRLAVALPQGGDILRQVVRDAREPGALSDVLAASVIVDPNARQELLEMVDVAARLQTVSEAVAELLRRLPSPPSGSPSN